jgi:hypothetical protein
MNKMITKGMAMLAVAAACGAAYTKSAFTTQAHLTNAESLANTLRTQGENGTFTDANGKALNQYGAAYKDVVMVWTPTAKVNAVCSNFITVLLEKTYGWKAKTAGFATASPDPAMYHDAIEANAKGFTHITEFENVAPGDLLISEYHDDHANIGHAMIVRNAQVVDEDEETGIHEWAVEVIDCTKNIHSNDSREFIDADGTVTATTQGVGRGTMRVLTLDGDIVGYSWSFRNGSVLYTPDVRHLTLGRLTG